MPDAESQVKGLLHEGAAIMDNGDLVRANDILERATTVAETNSLDAQHAQLLTTRAEIALVARDRERGTELAQRALSIARQNNLRMEEGFALSMLASAEYIALDSLSGMLGLGTGQTLARADDYSLQAERIFRDLEEWSRVAEELTERARLRQYRGEYAQAEALVREAINIAERVGDRPIAAWAYRMLGIVHSYNGSGGWRRNPALVDENFERARELARGAGVAHIEALILLEWATSWSRMGDRSRACPLIREALAIWRANVRGAARDEEVLVAREQRFCRGAN
jgi:tetratricopeptide (TPR) repeat protein